MADRPTPDPDDSVVEMEVRRSSVSDGPTRRDSLGFEPYVDAMAGFLLSADTRAPLTVSVEGEWGSGKSSFMLQLADRIEGAKKPVVWFSAWRHDKDESLWAAFALTFMQQLAKPFSWRARFDIALDLFLKRFPGVAALRPVVLHLLGPILLFVLLSVFLVLLAIGVLGPEHILPFAPGGKPIPGTTGWTTIAVLVCMWKLFHYLLKTLGNPLRIDFRKDLSKINYQDRVAFVEKFHEDFRLIVDAYAPGQKVFVFIDDLDRCAVPQAADLLQAINLLVGTDSRIVFILGLDREKVAAGLAAKFKDVLPYMRYADDAEDEKMAARACGIRFGQEFIEKFIQLPFRVPVSQVTELKRFFDDLARPAPRRSPHARVNHIAAWLRKAGMAVTYAFRLLVYLVRSLLNRVYVLGGAWLLRKEVVAPISAGVAPEVFERSSPAEDDEEPDRADEATTQVVHYMTHIGQADGPVVRACVQLIFAAMRGNPRRLKQFLNTFRLALCVEHTTGKFFSDSANRIVPIYPAQLAKYVAMGLRWPMLLPDIAEDPRLLEQLATYAEKGEHPSKDDASRYYDHWRFSEPDLVRLLQETTSVAACGSTSMANIDVRRLIQVAAAVQSPPTERVPVANPTVESGSQAESGGSSDAKAPSIGVAPFQRDWFEEDGLTLQETGRVALVAAVDSSEPWVRDAAVLSQLHAEWLLDYEYPDGRKGWETVSIDPDGNGYVLESVPRAEKPPDNQPHYRFVVAMQGTVDEQDVVILAKKKPGIPNLFFETLRPDEYFTLLGGHGQEGRDHSVVYDLIGDYEDGRPGNPGTLLKQELWVEEDSWLSDEAWQLVSRLASEKTRAVYDRSVISRIVGSWELTYQHGDASPAHETITVDEEGRYFIIKTDQGPTYPPSGPPKYKLKAAFQSHTSRGLTLVLLKEKPDGSEILPEVLWPNADFSVLTGRGRHGPGHTLEYVQKTASMDENRTETDQATQRKATKKAAKKKVAKKRTGIESEIIVGPELPGDLLTNDAVLVRTACDAIPMAERPEYVSDLVLVVENASESQKRRLSAGLALAYLGDPRPGQMVTIPAGTFTMGEGKEAIEVEVPEFQIDRYPVTNAQYKKFVDETKHRAPDHWNGRDYPPEKANHPVVNVTWHDAVAYAEWLGKRLPTEAEWEKAARGTDGRSYPWGNDWQNDACNSKEAGIGDTSPVGVFPAGRSPFGVDDMAGNVWEWCQTKWRDSYDQPEDNKSGGDLERVLRGGVWYNDRNVARCASRDWAPPGGRSVLRGFRVAQSV